MEFQNKKFHKFVLLLCFFFQYNKYSNKENKSLSGSGWGIRLDPDPKRQLSSGAHQDNKIRHRHLRWGPTLSRECPFDDKTVIDHSCNQSRSFMTPTCGPSLIIATILININKLNKQVLWSKCVPFILSFI